MQTHHNNSPLHLNEKLVQSIEVRVSQSVMTRTRLGLGIKRGIGSVKERMRLLRRSSKYDKGKGRMVLSKVDQRMGHEAQPEVEMEATMEARNSLREDIIARPVTARAKRREDGQDELEESGMGATESPRTQISWWEMEVDEYSGSEVEPFEFPWSSPPVGGDAKSDMDMDDATPGFEVHNESAFEDVIGDDDESVHGSLSHSRPQVHPRTRWEEEGKENNNPLPSEAGTQIHHRIDGSDIFESTEWHGPIDRSSDIGFDQNVLPRVLPYTREPDRIKIAALPTEVGEFLGIIIGVYNRKGYWPATLMRFSGPASARQRKTVSGNLFGIAHHASVLAMSLLLPDSRDCPLSRRILQELIGLDTATPVCHCDSDIHTALKTRVGVLLEEMERWLERLNKLCAQLVGIDDESWEEKDLRTVDEHRKWARRLCDEVLVLSCMIEVRFGDVGNRLRGKTREESGKERGMEKEEDEGGDLCEMCRAKRVIVEDEEKEEQGEQFSDEYLKAILAQLRKDDA